MSKATFVRRGSRGCISVILLVLAIAPGGVAADPLEVPLWKGDAPGGPTEAADEPVLFLYRSPTDAATRAAVIVCPGGGYGHLAMEKEGSKIAEWLNSFGVTAAVLRYRHSGTGHQHPVPMLDGQRAIRNVRSRAGEWGLDPAKIGVMGFSAGGHLASTLGTHFDAGDAAAADPIDRISSRPDFMILCYPVISFTDDFTHTGSRRNLLGDKPDAALVRSLSNHLQVTSETPPAFLFHTNGDTGVPPANSIVFYEALHQAGVPAELHIYENGGHGVGLAADIPGTRDWPERCRAWMKTRGLLER
jgi:acetyl esterase/lipase